MKTSPRFLILLTPVIGLTAGWQIKSHQSRNSPESSSSSQVADDTSSSRADRSTQAAGVTSASSLRSSDTAADLHALPAADLYDRMALFLLDAKAEDFPAFYEEFKNRTDRNTDLNDLLFISWTRIDPEAAVAASRGTDDFRYAYWAWACHDPGLALSSAIANGEGIGHAAWGIGEFHPEWLQENWDLIPEDQRGNAIQGLAKWPNTENPEASLRLLMKMGDYYYGGNDKTILALARQDPLHAYEVIKELTGNGNNYRSPNLTDTLINTLSHYNPELLGEIAGATRSPMDRNKIQLAQFKGLLRDDPAAAKAMIERTPKSWLKEDLMVNYATHLLSSDPEQGFDFAVDFLKEDFDGNGRSTTIRFKNGSAGSGSSFNDRSGELITALVSQDAPGLLDGLLQNSESAGSNNAFRIASGVWASQDVNAYADWLQDYQDEPNTYRVGVSRIVESLQNSSEFEAGMEWAQSIPPVDDRPNYSMMNLYSHWLSRDPDGATAWRLSDKFTGDPDQFPLPRTTEQE